MHFPGGGSKDMWHKCLKKLFWSMHFSILHEYKFLYNKHVYYMVFLNSFDF